MKPASRLAVCCLLAGVLLIAIAIVQMMDSPAQRQVAQAVPTVSLGVLPAVVEPAHQTPATHGTVPAGSRLRLPRLGVDAVVTPVAVTDHVMAVPADPRRLGWWSGGAAPGDRAGTTVLVGHVNYAGVSGALSALPRARPGDDIAVSKPGSTRHYRMIAVRSYPKTSGIPATVFSRTGPARLVLITCGGPFDQATGNYLDNIVAYAVPT